MATIATYRDALAYVYSLTDYERLGFAAYAPQFYNLKRVEQFLALLGNPERTYRAVHVAGTKGKGSTAAMIESVLRASGYRTGLYTSPHLHSYRERIQVNGDLIPEADVVRLTNALQGLAEQVTGITTFEVMTGMALAWFAEQSVEWAVLEVGLGGRLDATNVVTPEVSVITSISLDHTAVLGDTLAKIAAEKAGIVKPGIPVVSAPQDEESLAVIEAICSQRDAPLALVGKDWTWRIGQADLDGQSFAVHQGPQTSDELWIPLLGEHQLENATTAVATLSLLRERGVTIPPTALADGLRMLHWPGRLEVLGKAPFVVADCAHNGESAQKLMAALERHFDFWRFIVVLGASADHVTPELLSALLRRADLAIATRARHPRAASPEWIQGRAAALGFPLAVCSPVPRALELALENAGAEDLVCCTGSVFVAAEARLAWLSREGVVLPPVDPS
jgi:dihydrofolate synthase/folylpolyglutamate synthase